MHSEIAKWEVEIEQRLKVAVSCFDEIRIARNKLSGIIDHNFSVSNGGHISDLVASVFHCWVDEKCKEATVKFCANTKASITRKCLDNGEIDLDCGWQGLHSIDRSSVEDVSEHAMKCINTKALYDEIEAKGSLLPITGQQEAALALGNYLRVASYYDYGSTIENVHVRQAKGCFLLEASVGDEWFHTKERDLKTIADYAAVFENESETHGLVKLICAVIQEETDNSKSTKSSYSRVPSRTRINIEGVGSVVFFNEKIVYHLSSELFESLMAYFNSFLPEKRKKNITF